MSGSSSTLLVTGGCGFIGSCFIRMAIAENWCEQIINLDKLTYSGSELNLKEVSHSPKYYFVKGDIGDPVLVSQILERHKPNAILNFAAETHVDRSILDPFSFVKTNVDGTISLLQNSLDYWRALQDEEKEKFRFLHISTDEVYGSLGKDDPAFTEKTPYAPNSPYSASKASSDHFVRAYGHTYGLPVLTTNCSNNYGPHQFPEKLIPLIILNALQGKSLPIYGDGLNVRDWLYVEDHCRAVFEVLRGGRLGETYNIGGNAEKTNIEIVCFICSTLNEMCPRVNGRYEDLISHIKDRPGHDRRYAIDTRKIQTELGWAPKQTFESGLQSTIQWYLSNTSWVNQVTDGSYKSWLKKQYEV